MCSFPSAGAAPSRAHIPGHINVQTDPPRRSWIPAFPRWPQPSAPCSPCCFSSFFCIPFSVPSKTFRAQQPFHCWPHFVNLSWSHSCSILSSSFSGQGFLISPLGYYKNILLHLHPVQPSFLTTASVLFLRHKCELLMMYNHQCIPMVPHKASFLLLLSLPLSLPHRAVVTWKT